MGRFSRRLAGVAVIAAVLSGCATPLPGTRVAVPVAVSASVTAVGSAPATAAASPAVVLPAIEFASRPGHGPVVVFENGLGASMGRWSKVIAGLDGDTAWFAYNRPGTGASGAPVTPRDGEHIGDELRALLRGQGIAPPYVLVGHSLGGLYMQDFARRHPEDVAALVLVDSTHPTQFTGDMALDRLPWHVRAVLWLFAWGTTREELDLSMPTGAAVLALPPLAGKPVVVLSAEQPMHDDSPLGRLGAEKRLDIARLYPGSVQRWADSGHDIPWLKPEAVVDAIRLARQLAGEPAR
ncbi:alpha/beta fold hydrolase [Derxia gummosa]|uniref:Alpha/beta fold hydrolase n=1 Tax=Derxia gummosa DSM 723 TaxID=1121388 RepID=A0A8B6XD06_9BURK|nr:alpha/beta fold hydrolase [Derxia gummosa]